MYKLKALISFYCFAAVAVCADKLTINDSSFCVFREPVYKVFHYNFTSLTDPKKDIVIHHEHSNETIRMQLCYPLNQKCNGKDEYGICLIRDNQEIGIGKMPPEVNKEYGRILFIFTGDDCKPNEKYSVYVLMKCNYEVENNSSPQLISHTKEKCNSIMVWSTPLACGPRIAQNCTVTNNGLHYDLSPLTEYSQNYVIHTGNKTSPKIILNVCSSVIFEYNALCQICSGACLKDSAGQRYTDLGDVQGPPVFEDEKLKLKYEDGDICRISNSTVLHIKTTITFICDFDALDTLPEYVGGSQECHYQIIWKTVAACSVESLRNHSATTAGKCKMTNPLTNFTYDLQPLMHKEPIIPAQNGTKYKFGICKSPTNVTCAAGTGVCLTETGISMGKVNTNLMWQEGGPYLNYTDGDICEGGRHRYTIIAFVCGAEGSNKEPLVMEESSCELIIYWNTDLVCEKRIKCATDEDEINLSSLIKSTDNYVVKVNKTEFHINICRPLVSMPGLTCAHGTAVCKATLNSANEYVNETSLGFPKKSPTLNKDRETVLRYTSSTSCPENPNTFISSNFTFPCSYNDKGFPEYKGYANCTYMFEWRTSITCGAVIGNWSSPCILKDQLRSYECGLSLLNKEVQHVKNKQGKEYSISICGGEKYCNGSAVCQGGNAYGSLANVIFDYSRDVIKLQYSNGGKCGNSSYTSEMRFICNESMGIGAPKLLWESQCSAEFEWHTNATCNCRSSSPQPVGPVDRDSDIPNLSTRHISTVAGVVLTVITLVAALLYFRDPDKRTCFRTCLNPFSSRRSRGRVHYCRVDTTEDARLLLDVDPTQCLTDNDDELLIA